LQTSAFSCTSPSALCRDEWMVPQPVRVHEMDSGTCM
jgi:hypothetical protein